MKVVILGATGFVGSALCWHVSKNKKVKELVAVYRKENTLPYCVKHIKLEENELSLSLREALKNADFVFHCIGMAHLAKNSVEKDIYSKYIKVNSAVTLEILKSCVEAKVKHVVYFSSAKVYGESTTYGKSFSEKSPLKPTNVYAKSKVLAERKFFRFFYRNSGQFTIIRPPLILGENMKGNGLSILKLVDRNIPIPVGKINNKRSVLSLQSLLKFCDLILENRKDFTGIFNLSEIASLSTKEIIQQMAGYSGRRATIFNFPICIISFFCKLIRREDIFFKLTSDFELDSSKSIEMMNRLDKIQ